jgi:hypothetical protein
MTPFTGALLWTPVSDFATWVQDASAPQRSPLVRSIGPYGNAGVQQSRASGRSHRSASSSAAQVRTAGCIWLVALASFAGRAPALRARLGELQEAFSTLLGDTSETAQEMASRGLSLVYRLGDDAGRAQLLSSLMGTLQGAAAWARRRMPGCMPRPPSRQRITRSTLANRGGHHAA